VDPVGGARHEGEDVGGKFSGLAHQPEDQAQDCHVDSSENVLSCERRSLLKSKFLIRFCFVASDCKLFL
jgi:hypothetical protein